VYISGKRQAGPGCCAIILAILSSQALFAADESTGQALFEERCHQCHEQPDPAQPPDDGWKVRLDKMGVFARLKDKQKADVLAYLLSHSQDQSKKDILADDAVLLKDKCTVCHSMGRIVLEGLKGDAGKHILDRMQSYAGSNNITDDELNRILTYLQDSTDLAKPERVETSDPAELLNARCTACHSLERVFAKLRTEDSSDTTWTHIISRMRGKAPEWVTADEAKILADYISSRGNDEVAAPAK